MGRLKIVRISKNNIKTVIIIFQVLLIVISGIGMKPTFLNTSFEEVSALSYPTITHLSFNTSSAKVNDTILITFNATSSEYTINEVYINVANYSGIQMITGELTYNFTSNLWERTFKIGQYDCLGNYYIPYIRVNDFYPLYNNTHFTSPIVHVTGTTPDYTAPVLHSLSASSTQVNQFDTVVFSANITDDVSGTDRVLFNYCRISEPNHYYSYGEDPIYSETSGLWEFEIHFTDAHPEGLYIVKKIVVYDKAGNVDDLYNGTDYTSPIVNVSGLNPDYIPPVLVNVTAKSNFVTPGGRMIFYIEAYDELEDIATPVFGELWGSTGSTADIFFSPTDNELIWKGDYTISSNIPINTTYHFEHIYLGDTRDNVKEYQNGSDFISPIITVVESIPETTSISSSYIDSSDFVTNTSQTIQDSFTETSLLKSSQTSTITSNTTDLSILVVTSLLFLLKKSKKRRER